MRDNCESVKNLLKFCLQILHKEYFEDRCRKMCPLYFLQPINRIWPVEMKQSVRDLFHENNVAMSVEFKAWTDIIRVRLELNLDLDLGDVMSNFDGFYNITYQCLDRKLSVKTKTLKTR